MIASVCSGWGIGRQIGLLYVQADDCGLSGWLSGLQGWMLWVEVEDEEERETVLYISSS